MRRTSKEQKRVREQRMSEKETEGEDTYTTDVVRTSPGRRLGSSARITRRALVRSGCPFWTSASLATALVAVGSGRSSSERRLRWQPEYWSLAGRKPRSWSFPNNGWKHRARRLSLTRYAGLRVVDRLQVLLKVSQNAQCIGKFRLFSTEFRIMHQVAQRAERSFFGCALKEQHDRTSSGL